MRKLTLSKMNTKILSNSLKIISRAMIVLAMTLVATFVVQANSSADITFPVAELGNCADKTACKTYCSDSLHRDVCEAFAEQHNLGGGHGENNAQKLKAVEEDGGPGGCARDAEDPRSSCETYCAQREHMRMCVAYARDHGLMDDDELGDAEKVLKALDSGVKLPAACTDERSCKETCENPKDIETARQCFAFAEAAGLLPPGVDKSKAEKMFKAISEGKAPFKSPRDFKQCENPPSDEIFEKCVAFALENGFIPPEQVEMVRKTRGKGPGGCRGKEQCDTYCAEHEDECVAFAEEHGLISEEDKARRQEGSVKFKEALRQAPPEVAECLKVAVGAQVLDDIVAGIKPPSRDLGDKMHACFEQFFGPERDRGAPPNESESRGEGQIPSERMMRPGMEHGRSNGEGAMGRPDFGSSGFPPEVRTCIEEKIGTGGLQDVSRFSGDPMNSPFGAVIRDCYKTTFGEPTERDRHEGGQDMNSGPNEKPNIRGGEQRRMPPDGWNDNMNHVPPSGNQEFRDSRPASSPTARPPQREMPYPSEGVPYGDPQKGMFPPLDYRQPEGGMYEYKPGMMPNSSGDAPHPSYPSNSMAPEGFRGDGSFAPPIDTGGAPSNFFTPPSGESFPPPQPSSPPSSVLPTKKGDQLMANLINAILRR